MRVLFYLSPYISPTRSEYQHNSINLAEGMRRLGIEFYANINYWYINEEGKYLFEVKPSDFHYDIAVYSTFYFNRYPDKISEVDYSKINVLIDAEDGLFTHCFHSEYSKFNCILRTHYNKNFKYPKNVFPWFFGLSERIIKELEKSYDIKPLNRIYNNFRVSQNLRSISVSDMVPILANKYEIFNHLTDNLSITESNDDLSYWSQTGRRHNSEYYQLLNASMITLVFGGIIDVKPIERDLLSKFLRQYNKLMSRVCLRNPNKYRFIYQYDSWRLWEGFLSNTCPVHVDFEEWGLQMPFMPINGKHYIGVKGLDFKKTASDILDMTSEDISNIADNGRKWVLSNYSPEKIGDIFKQLINSI